MNIGQAIKEIRKNKDLSQGELAALIPLSQTSLSLIESGAKNPSSATVKKICVALEISEPLLYVMATDEADIPEQKRELFRILFPAIKGMINQIAK